MANEPKVYDLKIRSITKVERSKEDVEMVKYKLVARDIEGVNEVTVTSASPFVGMSAKKGDIQIVLRNSQTTLLDEKLSKKK